MDDINSSNEHIGNIITSLLAENGLPSPVPFTGLDINSPLPSPPPSPKKRLLNLRRKNYDMSKISLYTEYLQSKAMVDFKGLVIKKKCPDSEFVVPCITDCSMLLSYKYKKDQLKIIAKSYKLKVSGTNNDLTTRIYTYLKMSCDALHIQKMYRGYLQRRCNYLRGPGFLKRGLCNNDTDFLTVENMSDIPYEQFISYCAEDGFIYGFDILSLHNLKMNSSSNEEVKNPYTRSLIDVKVFTNMKRLIKISRKIYKLSLDINIEKEPDENLTLDERITRVFMAFDSHGHYSCTSWFTSLDKNNLIRFVRELADIWYFRASLTPELRYMICPQDPFRHVNILMGILITEQNLNNIREHVLNVIEKIATTGATEENRALGVIYILQTFTLVNGSARESMPWLYEAVAYTLSLIHI